jgi:methyl-accepting chemotaxis protein-1 (serine sensor receptor)
VLANREESSAKGRGGCQEALRHFDRIAAGDLSQRIEICSRDEMGALLRGLSQMRDGLANALNAVRRASDTIATAAQQIASGNRDLSSRMEQQAASLQETAASMEELTGAVGQNAENASQALTLATSATETAHHGSSAVDEMVATTAEIDQSSARIGDIIAIIEGTRFRPISLPSMRLSKPRVRVSRDADSRSWPPKCARLRNVPRRRPRRSRN